MKLFATIATLFTVQLLGATAGATALSDAAQQLQPGQWVELRTNGFNFANFSDGDAYDVFQYSEDLAWDPSSRQLLFIGGGHNSDAELMLYSEATNTWERRKPGGSGWACCSSHSYDHLAIVPSMRLLFWRQMAWDPGDRLEVYNIDTGAWSKTAAMPDHPGCCGGLEYFPEMNALVQAEGRTGVQIYDLAANRWTAVTANVAIGEYHNFAQYSPVHKVMIFGGGEGGGGSSVYRMDQNRQITRLRDAPARLGTTHAIVTTDPVSGNFLVFVTGAFYEFNPMTDTWLLVSNNIPWQTFGAGGVWSTVAAPISTYNVVVFAKYNGDSSRAYLYRHSPGSGTVTPTVTLSANPTSVAAQGSTTLTWSSTDATSCAASGGWSGAKATSGSETVGPLAVNTTFTLTCTGAGSATGSRSISVTVVSGTPAPTVQLQANPASVATGGSSTLSWTTSSASACTASGGVAGWPGAKSVPNGSQSLGPIGAQTTFNLSCTGTGGSAQANATVTLLNAPTLNFTAAPTTVSSGGTAMLTWSTQNATSCTASGAWAGAKQTSGQEQSGPLTTTSTFGLDCDGANGTVGRSVTVTVSAASTQPGTSSGGGRLEAYWLLVAALLLMTRVRRRNTSALR